MEKSKMMRLPIMFVKCEECGEEHCQIDKLLVENIEEDVYGRDVLTFVCPETGHTTTSLIYLKNQ
jgi:hypothetical protein